jgi:Xaa-Pro aminopeptidase
MLTQDNVIEKTWDDDRLRVERLAKLQVAMREQGVGAVLLKDWVNALYAINTKIPSGQTFVPTEGKPIAFTRPMDDGYVSMVGVETRPTIYLGNPSQDRDGQTRARWAAAIADLMVESGVGGQPLGVDALDPEGTIALHEAGLKLINARSVLQAAASVKTRDEVLIYWQTAKIYDRVMRKFREEVQPGVSEQQMINFIYSQVVADGWGGPAAYQRM